MSFKNVCTTAALTSSSTYSLSPQLGASYSCSAVGILLLLALPRLHTTLRAASRLVMQAVRDSGRTDKAPGAKRAPAMAVSALHSSSPSRHSSASDAGSVCVCVCDNDKWCSSGVCVSNDSVSDAGSISVRQ
jgi:hypothetical protein